VSPVGSDVLVASSVRALRTLLLEQLWFDHHRVDTVDTGDDLAALVASIESGEAAAPDVIVIDGQIRAADCVERLGRVRSRAEGPVVVFLAATNDYSAQAQAVRLGAVLLAKPVDLDDLRTVLLNLPVVETRH